MLALNALSLTRPFVLVAITLLLIAGTEAQMPANSSTTSTPVPGVGHDYIGEIAETVNPANGSVSIRLSPTIPPGRGLTLPFSFAYDSNGINYVGPTTNGFVWQLPSSTIVSTGGWSESAPVVSATEIVWTATDDNGKPVHCYGFVNYVFQDPKGNRHNLNLTNFNSTADGGACTNDTSGAPTGFSGQVVTQGGEDGYSPAQGEVIASIPPGDGSGASVGPVTVTQPDGTTFYFPNNADADAFGTMATSVEDRNGNVVQFTPPSLSGPYSYTDTVGRPLLQSSGFATSPETVTISGYNATYTLNWTPLSTPSFVAPLTTVSGSCTSGLGTHLPWTNPVTNGSLSAISTLKLPNGKSFYFTYDSTYKVVNKVTYPTGGYVRYVWGMNPQAEWYANANPKTPCVALYGVPVITDRYVSFNGTAEVLHQQFSYSTAWNLNDVYAPFWTSKTTKVTTTDNVRGTSYKTIYTYSASAEIEPPNTWSLVRAEPIEQSIAYYDTTGSLLKTVAKTWLNPRLLASQTTTYPTGQASEITWSYNSREQQTEQDDYDFGTSGVGSLLRKTVTNYQAFNDTPLYSNAPSIVDRPCQIITYDGSGTNRAAESDFYYDDGSTSAPCGAAGTPSVTGAGGSSLTGHDETSYSASSTSPRGNLTTMVKQCFPSSACAAGNPKTTYAYDETGQTASMTDANGNTTSYSYADSFVSTNSTGFTTTAGDPPSGKVTNAYLTKITMPSTNGVAHVEKFAYGYNDGELTESFDQNTPPNVTTYRYNDSLGRLTEADYPDTGKTTLAYNDAAPSPTITTTKLITSNLSLSTTATMDGLGHPVQTELTTDPEGPVFTTTSYDGLGRKETVSNPYRSTSDVTYGSTTTNYDSLSRVTSIVEQDGSTVTTSYSGNQTTVTDEVGINAKARRTDSDGLPSSGKRPMTTTTKRSINTMP